MVGGFWQNMLTICPDCNLFISSLMANIRYSVSNHRRSACFFKSLFVQADSKGNIKSSPYWCHDVMSTSSNENILRITGLLCGEFTYQRWIPRTKASDAELWCFLWSAPKPKLSKQWRRRWFETPSCSLWRHCNGQWCGKRLHVMTSLLIDFSVAMIK